MTGHQNNPENGLTIRNDPTVAVNLEALAHAIGINSVRVVDPFNVAETKKVVKEELSKKEPSLIISRRPCALLKTVKHGRPLVVNKEKCIGFPSVVRLFPKRIQTERTRHSLTKTSALAAAFARRLADLAQ